jgi:hypothetical protein
VEVLTHESRLRALLEHICSGLDQLRGVKRWNHQHINREAVLHAIGIKASHCLEPLEELICVE